MVHEDLGVVELTPAHDDADDNWSELVCAGREVPIGLSNMYAINAFFRSPQWASRGDDAAGLSEFDGGGPITLLMLRYLDHIDFGFVVCPEIAEEPWHLADAKSAA